jgi:UDP-glucose 4-epimerase
VKDGAEHSEQYSMKLLVTGAGGFIGRSVVDHFAGVGWQVYGVSRTTAGLPPQPNTVWYQMVLPDSGFATLLHEWRPDVVVHAASTAIVGQSVDSPLQDFERSVRVWAHVIEAVRRSRIRCRVLLLSSAAVYGNPATLPIDENQPMIPVSPYGYHKKMCEEIAEYYAGLYNVAVCSMRIFSAYGPRLRRQVIWDICQKALSGDTIELMGTGDESRDFIHVGDVAGAVATIIERGDFQAGVYNVASGVSTTIRDAAGKLVQALGTNNAIRFNGARRAGDPLFWQADISKLAWLGWASQVPFDEGLAAYARWALQEQPDSGTH